MQIVLSKLVLVLLIVSKNEQKKRKTIDINTFFFVRKIAVDLVFSLLNIAINFWYSKLNGLSFSNFIIQ